MRPARRWFQYSLRAFFVAMTALGVWLGLIVNSAREQREAVKAIEAVGGMVIYDWACSDEAGTIRIDNFPHEPVWLLQTVGVDFFHQVEEVDFGPNRNYLPSKADVLNSIPHLRRIRGLKRVVLWSISGAEHELTTALPACEVKVLSVPWEPLNEEQLKELRNEQLEWQLNEQLNEQLKELFNERSNEQFNEDFKEQINEQLNGAV